MTLPDHVSVIILISLTLASCRKADKDTTGGHGHSHGTPITAADLAQAPSTLSAQALSNMGVEIKEVDSSQFIVYEPVPALIKETPRNERPLYAPFSGRVKSINVVLGESITSAQAVVELIRDPIHRTELTLIDELLKPASDEFHNTIAELRKAHVELSISDKELARLEKVNKGGDGATVIPQQTIINLKYEGERMRQEITNLRGRLALHGFSKREIADIEKGRDIVLSRNLWLSALKQNGMWDKTADAIYSLLPKEIKANQWAVATLGELKAEGLLNTSLVAWFKSEPKAASYMIEIGGLLQQGNSLEAIRNLYALDAFEPIIIVKSPVNKMGWDIEKVQVKTGEHVDMGAELITLSDNSQMYLVASPVGSEMTALSNAAANNHDITAIPLIKGSGPTLKGLKITKILGLDNEGSRALLPVTNQILNEHTEKKRNFRNWALRNELRYILQIPGRVLDDVIVLPSTAIVEKGADKVIYVKEPHGFKECKVSVVYQDDAVAVLGEWSEVFPEEAMVTKGAFSLSLALRAAGGDNAGADAHAGCDHD